MHAVLAVDTNSDPVHLGAGMVTSIARVDPLSWIGDSVAIYLDDDPLWAELAKIEGEARWKPSWRPTPTGRRSR